jgi:hypothetical protein
MVNVEALARAVCNPERRTPRWLSPVINLVPVPVTRAIMRRKLLRVFDSGPLQAPVRG